MVIELQRNILNRADMVLVPDNSTPTFLTEACEGLVRLDKARHRNAALYHCGCFCFQSNTRVRSRRSLS
jgi:hypothetical protein